MGESTLPAPPLPADLDLSTLEYMPLLIVKLRRSKAWLRAKRRPELGFYMLNLWMAAWMETPAASMEDDDDVLADAAMCPPDVWDEVRSLVLHGFYKCSDDRLYHPTLVEQAMVSLEKRMKWRAKKKDQRGAKNETVPEVSPETIDGHDEETGIVHGDNSIVPGDVSTKPAENAGDKPLRDGTGRDVKVREEEPIAPTIDSEPAKPVTTQPGSGGVSGLKAVVDGFDWHNRSPDPSDPSAPLKLPEPLKDDAGAIAALPLVNEFVRLRSIQWPGCSYPDPTNILIEQARPLMATGVPLNVFSEVLAQHMRERAGKGQESAFRSLKFCHKSLEEAATKYLAATQMGAVPLPAKPDVADLDVEGNPLDAGYVLWRRRVRAWAEDPTTWFDTWGGPPSDPDYGQRVDVMAEVFGPDWKTSMPPADTHGRYGSLRLRRRGSAA